MILDCTIRDGGYYNKWDFDLDLVNKYLKQINESKVECVEIGYRSLKNDNYYGPFYYCTEDFLNTLNIPKNLNLAVMINANEIEHYSELNQDLIDILFDEKNKSIISTVRIASNLDSVVKIIPAIHNLKNKGYKVSLNLMKITNISNIELVEILEILVKRCDIDIFCIADSFGNLSESTLLEKLSTIKGHWNNEIGVHLHNNQGRACTSSLAAYKFDVDWIDTTILGMGRGAGNASTERLMLDINESTKSSEAIYKPEKIFGIVLNEFSELNKKYNWGYNLLYEISSRYSLHPNHVMELMTSKNRYSPDQMLTSMYKLIEQHGKVNLSEKTVENPFKAFYQWSEESPAKERIVLLLGPGDEGRRHSLELQRYIKDKKPLVISLNTIGYLPFEHVDIFVFLNEFRVIAEIQKIEEYPSKILLPADLISKEALGNIDTKRVLNHSVRIESNQFKSNENDSVIPYEVVFAYIFTALLLDKPNIIYFFGLDGYFKNDSKQNQMLEIFKFIEKANSSEIPIFSLTNTSYPVNQKSIYGPQV